jgi:hypothetical protein
MSNLNDNTYNGWTNYATWRVNLEIFDGMDINDMGWRNMDKFELAPILRDYAEELIEQTAPEGLACQYALAFVCDVDYREIAEMMINQNT